MLSDLHHLRSLLPATHRGAAASVAEMVVPVDLIDGHLPLPSLERAFRSPHLSCVAVQGDDDAVGLVTRARYLGAAAGDLGFGRALLARATVADVTDWAPTLLDPGTGVVEAAIAVTSRGEAQRFDPVLVRTAQWGVLFPADLVRALSAQLAVSTLRDELTGLGSLRYAHVALDAWRRRAAGTPHHVAVVAVRLDGLHELRSAAGDEAADAVVLQAADHLRATSPAGWEHARTGPGDLALVGALPGPVDPAAAMASLAVVERAIGGFHAVGAPDVRWRSAAVCSASGGAAPERLLRAARQGLAGTAHRARVPAPASRRAPAAVVGA